MNLQAATRVRTPPRHTAAYHATPGPETSLLRLPDRGLRFVCHLSADDYVPGSGQLVGEYEEDFDFDADQLLREAEHFEDDDDDDEESKDASFDSDDDDDDDDDDDGEDNGTRTYLDD